MTREEALNKAINIVRYFEANFAKSKEAREEAVNIIKALEQEPILDKVRAEIMQLDYNIESVDYDYNDMAQTEMIHTICREEVLRIIDKYKAESEEV